MKPMYFKFIIISIKDNISLINDYILFTKYNVFGMLTILKKNFIVILNLIMYNITIILF